MGQAQSWAQRARPKEAKRVWAKNREVHVWFPANLEYAPVNFLTTVYVALVQALQWGQDPQDDKAEYPPIYVKSADIRHGVFRQGAALYPRAHACLLSRHAARGTYQFLNFSFTHTLLFVCNLLLFFLSNELCVKMIQYLYLYLISNI